ncbi:hypothetical protein F0U62_17880 [Cystobacter fuscus]|uniref:hypothetical protein n=1 Tax=Cystobacter fuscus TaxID=43 RepID=UPI002B2C9F9D|nr:hypothetical protein F0U62_17880 [Cystobacter fuscus]
MLIICTRDNSIRNYPNSANTWGTVVAMNNANGPQAATQELQTLIGQLGPNEPLCLSAHGNDEAIGDEQSGGNNWGWSVNDIAGILRNSAPAGYSGPILVHACMEKVENFTARLALALEGQNVLNGVWIYGTNRDMDCSEGYPRPTKLDDNAALQSTRVGSQSTRSG